MRALVLVVVGLLVAPARADVTLEQPAGVCSLDGVRAELAALPHPAHDATVLVETALRDGRVEASVTIGGATRAVSARGCRELATSIALIIVMALRDAPPQQIAAAIEPPLAIAPPPRVLEPLPAAPARDVSRVARPGVRVALLLGAAADLRGHPSLVAGGRIGRGRWSLGLEVQAEAESSIALENGGEISMSRTSVAAAPCARLAGFGLCGLAAGGALRGRGIELADATVVTRPIAQLGARAEWSYPLVGGFALRIHVDATQALTSARFLVDQMPVWTSDSRELRLGAGVVANSP